MKSVELLLCHNSQSRSHPLKFRVTCSVQFYATYAVAELKRHSQLTQHLILYLFYCSIPRLVSHHVHGKHR